ncbi:MAG: four helix bundle protein [Flammeovirgaceae bacterium]|nr:MAG: four helix bundle protein [Flammeovirgaceae bacterium]
MNSGILKQRTKRFALDVTEFCMDLKPTLSILAYSKQLIRSSSSVGANYRAACRAKSRADFINKLKIVEEEADESIYFIELIIELEPDSKTKGEMLLKEGNELLAIIVASINTSRKQKG